MNENPQINPKELRFIERFQKSDIPAILEVEKAVSDIPLNAEQLEAFIDDEPCRIVGVEYQNKIIAFSSIIFYKMDEIEITDFVIHPEYQKGGVVAEFLINQIKKEMMDKDHDDEFISVRVRETDEATQKFYSKHDFQAITPFLEGTYSDGEKAVIMVHAGMIENDLLFGSAEKKQEINDLLFGSAEKKQEICKRFKMRYNPDEAVSEFVDKISKRLEETSLKELRIGKHHNILFNLTAVPQEDGETRYAFELKDAKTRDLYVSIILPIFSDFYTVKEAVSNSFQDVENLTPLKALSFLSQAICSLEEQDITPNSSSYFTTPETTPEDLKEYETFVGRNKDVKLEISTQGKSDRKQFDIILSDPREDGNTPLLMLLLPFDKELNQVKTAVCRALDKVESITPLRALSEVTEALWSIVKGTDR